jgi:hypothetical protein
MEAIGMGESCDRPGIHSSFTREASGPVRRGRFPGSRVVALTPRPSPDRVRVARHASAHGGGLAGYSGGTAQAFDLLPFSPLPMRGTPIDCPQSEAVGRVCQGSQSAMSAMRRTQPKKAGAEIVVDPLE